MSGRRPEDTAAARLTGLVKIDSVADAIMETVPIKKEANVKAARDAFERLVL